MLNVPENVMEAMAIRSSYYTNTSTPLDPGRIQESVDTLALTALLVASNNLHRDKALTLVETLTKKGDVLQLSSGQKIFLRTPESAIEKSPIPLHDGLKNYLRKQGHLGQDFNAWLAILVICSLIGAVVYVQLRMRSYDRMGNLTVKKGSPSFYIHQLVAKAGSGLIVIFTFSLLVILFIEAIQYFED